MPNQQAVPHGPCCEIEHVGAPHVERVNFKLLDAAIDIIKDIERKNEENLNDIKIKHNQDTLKLVGNHMEVLSKLASEVDTYVSKIKDHSDELPMEPPKLERQDGSFSPSDKTNFRDKVSDGVIIEREVSQGILRPTTASRERENNLAIEKQGKKKESPITREPKLLVKKPKAIAQMNSLKSSKSILGKGKPAEKGRWK